MPSTYGEYGIDWIFYNGNVVLASDDYTEHKLNGTESAQACPNCKGTVIDYDDKTGACYTCGTLFSLETNEIIEDE